MRDEGYITTSSAPSSWTASWWRYDANRSLCVFRSSLISHLSSFILHPFLGLLATVLIAGVALAAESTSPPTSPAPGPLILDDIPRPMAQQEPRSEAERDHLEAIARFAAGTMHQRREEYSDALRCYQRALRCDPTSATIARAVISMAFRLKRYSLAVYALKAVEAEDADPMQLCRLGAFLTEDGDWAEALTLYEKALAARSAGKDTAADILMQMEMGRLYYLTEQREKAADCFTRVLWAIDHPNEFALDQKIIKILLGKPDLTYQLMGECFLVADRPREAQTVFEKADPFAPDKALQQFNLARVYAKTDEATKALATLEACFAEHLTDQGMAPYETLADVLDSLGKKNELLDRLEKLRAADPNDLALGYYLAAQYRAAGKSDQAEALYLELLKIKPMLLGYRSLVELGRRNKRFDNVLNVLGEAIERTSVLDILGAEAQTISGDAEAMQGIVEAARNQLKTAPEKFGYGRQMAVALLALEAKQYETAAEFFDLALAVARSSGDQDDKAADASTTGSVSPSRSAEALMAWGVGLLLGDRPDEAAKVFQRGIDENVLPEDNPAFYFYLAGALAIAGRHDEALAAARTAAEKNPSSARYCGRAAWVQYIAKRYIEAQKAYRRLIDQFDDAYVSVETREVLHDARLALSNLAVIQGDMAEAEEWLEQVLDEFPDDEGALNDLGYLWADQNKHLERSERMIRKAVAIEPNNRAYRDSLGWVLFRMGKYSEAVAELEKAAATEKPDGVVLDHLGDAYQKLNQPEKAVQTWRKAAKALRQDNEIEKAESVEKKIIAN